MSALTNRKTAYKSIVRTAAAGLLLLHFLPIFIEYDNAIGAMK
jgi:hypothetical protein